MPLLELDSSSSSSGSETESSEPESTDSSEDEGQRTSKIKMPGESLDKIKKPSSAAKSKSSPKLETESPVNVESPQKEQPRKSSLTKEPPSLNKMLRKPSLTKNTLPNRQEPSKKSTPGLPVINDRIKFMKMFEQLQHEKLEPTGYIPGRLVQELEDAVNKGTINDFGRKLVGMKSLNPDAGKFTISEEVNGKLGDSALCKAASVRVDKGGPSLITSLVHIAGADTHQTNYSGNTALHIAAEAGIPGNVATLLSYKSPINVRNNKKETALLLAVRRATKFEKLYHKNMNSSVLAIEFKMQWSDAFRCVEMLLSAGGNIDKMTLQAAETSSAADLLYLYHYTVIENVYKFVKSTLGKANLTVHDRLLYSATIVPRDQNIFEFTLDPVEFLRPGMFLTLFAVHGRHEGFSSDFEKLQDLRLSGNPCLLSEAKWLSHSPDLYPKKPSILSLEGFPSWSLMVRVHLCYLFVKINKGPFEPGKDLEKYKERVENQHFVTFLNYTPFRENRYTLSIVPDGAIHLSV
ncbi:unnamed protein product [Oikopleura dioica]|uniref:Uncharacterized protein n=1 Tax=Oikopleura dioica TaxID=34765 RepID=E4YL08_OIKDI|nr:unnamed protein product [Oikopleura dioica]